MLLEEVRAACWEGEILAGQAHIRCELVGEAPRKYELVVTLPDDEVLRTSASDLFECLYQLRRQHLDQRGVLLAVNGARLNAWPSGLLRDTGGGFDLYLFHLGYEDLLTVKTFDPAPIETIVSASEQRAFFEQWFTEPHTSSSWRPDGVTAISRQLLEAISWRFAAEVCRHAPSRLAIFETHPGGGLYDCLSIRDIESGEPLVEANRQGRVHFPATVGYDPIGWTEVIAPGGLGSAITRAIDLLGLPASVPASTPIALTYRLMADVVGYAAFSRGTIEWRSGYADSSQGSGPRFGFFAGFPQIARSPSPWHFAPQSEYGYWFLLVEGTPVAALDHARGVAWDLGGEAQVLAEV
jgi:hypothetical protein